jgi:hypothetical protein
MDAHFTREQRQEIIAAHCRRHGGMFDPLAFLREATDETHPGHSWFDWESGPAISDANLERARQFADGLKVDFRLEAKLHRFHP